MTKDKNIRYKKAYVELYEILNVLEKEQKDKIPENFINNISNNMDKDYKFYFDMSKGIFEQDLMVETEALLVEIYERYLAPDKEKEMWQKYDRFCLNKIEEDKKARFNNNIFKNNKYSIFENDMKKDNNILPIKYEEKSILKKFLNYIKNIFKR